MDASSSLIVVDRDELSGFVFSVAAVSRSVSWGVGTYGRPNFKDLYRRAVLFIL